VRGSGRGWRYSQIVFQVEGVLTVRARCGKRRPVRVLGIDEYVGAGFGGQRIGQGRAGDEHRPVDEGETGQVLRFDTDDFRAMLDVWQDH